MKNIIAKVEMGAPDNLVEAMAQALLVGIMNKKLAQARKADAMKKEKIIALRILGVIFFLAGIITAVTFYKEGFTTWAIAAAIAVGIVGTERCLHYANKVVQRKG